MKHSLMLLLAACFAVPAFAVTPLPQAPAGQEYRYDSRTGDNYVGLRLYPTQVTPPPPPPGGCLAPQGLVRVTRGQVGYGTTGLNRPRSTALTEWQSLYGFSGLDQVTPYPFNTGSGSGPIIGGFPKNGYLALHFNTGVLSALSNGYILYPSNIGGPDITVSISKTCGDFSNSLGTGCYVTAIASDDQPRFHWWSKAGNASWCGLESKTDYWFNLRYTDPNSRTECAGASCPLYTARYGHP